MKYLKLFEEHRKGVYELTREIPITHEWNGMAFKGSEQFLALVDYSRKRGYNIKVASVLDKNFDDMIARADATENTVFWWNKEQKYCYYTEWKPEQVSKAMQDGSVVEFDDYFNATDSHKGYVAGKKYGI
jgi:hypothetical protein